MTEAEIYQACKQFEEAGAREDEAGTANAALRLLAGFLINVQRIADALEAAGGDARG